MLDGSEIIIDREIQALAEPLPVSHYGHGRRRRRREQRRAVSMLLHPDRRMEEIFRGSLAEQLQGTPPTRALRTSITQKLIRLFWTILPEQDEQWLHATNVAHDIADGVISELEPRQMEEEGVFPLPTSPESDRGGTPE